MNGQISECETDLLQSLIIHEAGGIFGKIKLSTLDLLAELPVTPVVSVPMGDMTSSKFMSYEQTGLTSSEASSARRRESDVAGPLMRWCPVEAKAEGPGIQD